jgi:hypothetical protein
MKTYGEYGTTPVILNTGIGWMYQLLHDADTT